MILSIGEKMAKIFSKTVEVIATIIMFIVIIGIQLLGAVIIPLIIVLVVLRIMGVI